MRFWKIWFNIHCAGIIYIAATLDNEAFIHNKGPRTFRSESPVRFMEVICVHMNARILKSPFTILDIINHIYYQILYCVK